MIVLCSTKAEFERGPSLSSSNDQTYVFFQLIKKQTNGSSYKEEVVASIPNSIAVGQTTKQDSEMRLLVIGGWVWRKCTPWPALGAEQC